MVVERTPRDELESHLTDVPGVGPTLADRALAALNPSSLSELRQQIANDRLRSINGFGPERNRTVKEQFDMSGNGSDASDESSRTPSPIGNLPERIRTKFRCPVCLTDSLRQERLDLICGECGANFPIRRGIVDFVAERDGSGGFAQGVMELPFYARWYEFFRPSLTRLISSRSLREEYALSTRLLDLSSDSDLLDVGCGTGNFTRTFARHLGALDSNDTNIVTGLDLSWPMLNEARERSFREDLENRLQYVRGDALNLPFRDERFDRLHCAGSLHLMESIQTVLAEFRRVLVPGATLVLGTFLLGDGTLRPLVKRLGGWLTQFHWFGENELHERLRGEGFIVDEFSVAGDAVTVQATLRS